MGMAVFVRVKVEIGRYGRLGFDARNTTVMGDLSGPSAEVMEVRAMAQPGGGRVVANGVQQIEEPEQNSPIRRGRR